MVVKSLDDDDSSDDKLNGIQKVSYLLGVKRFAIGVTCSRPLFIAQSLGTAISCQRNCITSSYSIDYTV